MSDHKLAHIIYRVCKQLVSLLEQEYSFGKPKAEFQVFRVDVRKIEGGE